MDILIPLLASWLVFFFFRFRDFKEFKKILTLDKAMFLGGGVIVAGMCLITRITGIDGMVYPFIFFLLLTAICLLQRGRKPIFFTLPAIAFIANLSLYILPQTRYNLVLMPISFVVMLLALNAMYRVEAAGETNPPIGALMILTAMVAVIDCGLMEPRAGLITRALFAAAFGLLLNVKTGKDGEYYASEKFITAAIKPAALFLILQLFIAAIIKHPAFF